jgi:hypothetical protein
LEGKRSIVPASLGPSEAAVKLAQKPVVFLAARFSPHR